jgi:hypothetical protein
LCGLAYRGLVAGAVHVVGAEHVGDEQAVEPSPFEQFRQLGPVAEILVSPGLVFGMTPQPRGLVGDAVHVEGIEADNAGH